MAGAPAASGAASPVPSAGGPAAAPVVAGERRRVQIAVIEGAQPAREATLTAVDLATGKALPLTRWSGPPGGALTAVEGAFDLALPALADEQVVKIIAVTAKQTYTALLDGRGRTVGAGGPSGGYRLRQGSSASQVIRLQLTAASTGATQCFEGVLKLTFRLPEAVREAELAATLAQVEQAGRELEAALARRPELAQALLAGMDATGAVADVAAFRSTIARLGVFNVLDDAVQGRLQAVTAHELTERDALGALAGPEFPLARVTISQPGGFHFSSDLDRASRRGAEATAPSASNLGFTVSERLTLARVAGNATGAAGSDTSATTTALRAVSGVAVAPDGTLFVADPLRHQVLRSVAGGTLVRIAGAVVGKPGFADNVVATGGWLNAPTGLLWDAARGALLVCDTGNGRVRLVLPGGTIATVAGGGATVASPTTATELQLGAPVALAAASTGTYYVADRSGGRVWRLESSGVATLVASIPGACALALDAGRDLLWVGTTAGAVWRVTAAGTSPSADLTTPVFSEATLAVHGLASDRRGVLFVLAATAAGDARLWRVPTDSQGQLEAGQAATPIAGTGAAGADGAAYAVPTMPLADARQARLSTLHPGSLTIDLSAADAVATPSGQLYVGSSYAGDVTWGQALRLELTF